MLDEFIDEQKVPYRIFINTVIKNKCSHAYLIETNGYSKKEELAFAFAKYLFCPYNYSNKSECVKCTQCDKIDKEIFSEFKVIRPDGLWIKKEQLLELQEQFKTKGILSNKRIYIITDAAKLNATSSNTILKFLEEPSENVIAILLADNIHQLLDTIVSRCQVITLKKNLNESNKLESLLSVKIENLENIKENTVKFVNTLELKKNQTIILAKKLFHNNIQEKNETLAAVEIMILYYRDMLNIKLNRKTLIFDEIDANTIKNNNINIISKKIKILLDIKNKLYINANTNLLIDKLIIEIGGVK